MGTTVTQLCLCILTALLACTVQGNRYTTLSKETTVPESCSPDIFHQARVAAEFCNSSHLSSWTAEDRAQLLQSLATLTTKLKQASHRMEGCHLYDGSPSVEVHSNGGVVCVDIKEKVYCKPMCDQGYDFSFLRRGRPYEVCSAGSWTTQFIGGKRLAVCNPSTIQISANPSAYFKDKDCPSSDQDQIIQEFITELRAHQITGDATNGTLIC